MTVVESVAGMLRHPARFLVTRWNWKAALISALMRGAIFFGATVGFGLSAAAKALLVDAIVRVPMAGTYAAVIQEVRWAEPYWAAAAIAVVGVPLVSHTIEIAVHAAAMTPLLWRGVGVSIGLSVMSGAIELFLMRHDVMLVEPGAGSLVDDLRRLARLARMGRG